jgi:hypothetical protein
VQEARGRGTPHGVLVGLNGRAGWIVWFAAHRAPCAGWHAAP